MDSMEHNISKDDAAAETTRLQPRREMRQNVDVTIVNGVTYVGAADGVVSALRASDGTVLWHYTTQGSADEQPLVVNGVVYVSTDLDTGVGSVYALRANDGTLLWRYTSADHLVYQPTVV